MYIGASSFFFSSCVPNVLLTSCVDNVCRLWSETVKYKPSHHNLTTERPQTYETGKSNFTSGNKSNMEPYADEKFHFHQRYHLVSMFHFHLAAVINPSSDIALLSTIPVSSIFGRSFQLEWLNNKEVQLTTAVEAMFASVKIQAENEESSLEESEVDDTDAYLLVDGIDGELSFREESLTDSDKILNRTLEEGLYIHIPVTFSKTFSKSTIETLTYTATSIEPNQAVLIVYLNN